MNESKYHMTITLNVLNHLGINLYSNVPAVLSEVVANAWDADADEVNIEIQPGKIIISDNGHGMDENDINERYLSVGYERREDEKRKTENAGLTPKYSRKPMGRKGLGKLSLFAIASTYEVHTMKDGVKNGFLLSEAAINELQKQQHETPNSPVVYEPDIIPEPEIEISKNGTRIIMYDLKKRTHQTSKALKKRIARRFSIIGSEHNFTVKINGDVVSVTDRDYFHKIEYLWYYGGDESLKYTKYCNQLEYVEPRANEISNDELKNADSQIDVSNIDLSISGWIGTSNTSGDLKDEGENLNKIVVMVRGKLAQEDILEEFTEGGVYTKYLMGEIHADFLDLDHLSDTATSNRQEIIKDDPRYQLLKSWLHYELRHIKNLWTDLRNERGAKAALMIPAIKEWFDDLKTKHKKYAKSLFGKINQLDVESNDQKKQLYKHSVLAFESFKYKENLDALESISIDNIEEFTTIFAELDDIEASLYHQIVNERLNVIKALQDKIEDNALEKVVQEHLYKHLWLLDASWDRATETPYLEQQVATAFEKVDAKLNNEERKGRFDIRYKKTSGKHVIIELKRSERAMDSNDLAKQAQKYYRALRKVLREVGSENEPIEVVCLVGKPCSDWDNDPVLEERSRLALEKQDIRIILYRKLINDAYITYQEYLEKNQEAGRILKLIQSIDTTDFDAEHEPPI